MLRFNLLFQIKNHVNKQYKQSVSVEREVMTPYLKYFWSFLIIFGVISSICCFLIPLYDENQGENKFYDIKKSFALSCKVSEKEENANDIKWGKQHPENVTSSLKLSKHEIKNTRDMSTFVIHKARKEDAGQYYCQYGNQTFNFSVISNLRVKIKPATDVCVVEGDVLLLKCVGVGTKIHLKWKFPHHIKDIKYIQRFGDHFESNTLVIKKVEKWQHGVYTCEGRYNETLAIETVVKTSVIVRVRPSYVDMFNVDKWPESCSVFLMSNSPF